MSNYDAEEAKRLLVDFARGSKAPEPPAEVLVEAARRLLAEFSTLALKSGFTIQRLNQSEGEGIEVGNRAAGKSALVLVGDPAILVATPWGKDKEKLPLAWNPHDARFEGLDDDAGAPAAGARRQKRSALAVLTEAVLKRLQSESPPLR